MVRNGLNGYNLFADFDRNLYQGALGGFSSAIGKDLLIGAPSLGAPTLQGWDFMMTSLQ